LRSETASEKGTAHEGHHRRHGRRGCPESDLIPIEGNYYFPPSSLSAGAFSESPTPYTCPWKGAYPALYLFCTDAPPAGAADSAAAVIIAESFGALLGRSLGAGIVSVSTTAGVAPSAGLAAAYAVFAAALALGVAASSRLAPGRGSAEPSAASAPLPAGAAPST
jgi:hypothetical protein